MRRHLPVLDGLRGIAALSVVIFHFQELTLGSDHPDGFWLRHAYLAVDFFFCLSGYVMGYAYDDRRDQLGVRGFIAARLIRLHPMVVLGIGLGLVSYLFDPFNHSGHPKPWLESQQVPLWKVLACAIGGIFMLPTGPLPNRFGSYFPLNAPSWSLMWEYLASLAFAVALWRVRRGVLLFVVLVAALALAIASVEAGTVSLGWGWGQMLYGLIRVSFSFSIGLLLFRSGINVKFPTGFVLLSGLLLLIFILPGYGNSETGNVPWNGVYDFVAVVFALPLIVLLGAGASTSGIIGAVCNFCGRISYPLYIVHYAFITLFANYVWTRPVTDSALVWIISAGTVLVTAISYAALVLYDEPVRRYLTRWKPKARLAVSATTV